MRFIFFTVSHANQLADAFLIVQEDLQGVEVLDDLLLVPGPRELEGLLEALVDLPRVRQLEEVEVLVDGAQLNNNLPYGGSAKQQPPIALGPLPPPQNRNRPRAHLLTLGGGGDGGEGRGRGRGRRSGRLAFPIPDRRKR